jgi:hypothetical protein
MEFVTGIWRFGERRLEFVTLKGGETVFSAKIGRLMASIKMQTAI